MWTEITRPKYERKGSLVFKRPDRCRMSVDRAAITATQPARTAAEDRNAHWSMLCCIWSGAAANGLQLPARVPPN
jgi:hypothetical protein